MMTDGTAKRQETLGTCARCGGKFPTRTSGMPAGETYCTSAAQCDANIAAKAAVVEASTIGLEPGEWPRDLHHGGRTFRLLRKDDVKRDADNDIVSVTYREVRETPGATLATATATLEVLND